MGYHILLRVPVSLPPTARLLRGTIPFGCEDIRNNLDAYRSKALHLFLRYRVPFGIHAKSKNREKNIYVVNSQTHRNQQHTPGTPGDRGKSHNSDPWSLVLPFRLP